MAKKNKATSKDNSSEVVALEKQEEKGKAAESYEECEVEEYLNAEQDIADPEFEGLKDVGSFTILGDFKPKEKKRVERVLPSWLKNPVIVRSEDNSTFSNIKELDRSLVQKLKDNGIDLCFPVQWTVIPELLAQCRCGVYAGDAGFRPRDICVSAPTGSGKTLTFALPIIQALQHRIVPHVRALIILPVRDLAMQVYRVFEQYTDGTPLKVILLAGKKEFHQEQRNLVRKRAHASSSESWASMADIVIATRGRLLDHIDHTEGFDLTHLRFLVIDEADRQMEDIYDDWLSQIETAAYTPKLGAYASYRRSPSAVLTISGSKEIIMHPQKLLFSATLSQNPEKLEQLNLFSPLLFTTVAPGSVNTFNKEAEVEKEMDVEGNEVKGLTTVDQYSAPEKLKEKYMDCKSAEKPLILLHFVLNKNFKQVLCFTNTVESAHRLYLLVKQTERLKVAEISSNIHTEKRERILRQFARGQLHLLICSDVMTRGMDIENVQYVISYDAPSYIETYIHRVGRTARANKAGTAITLLEGKEVFHFKKMLRGSGRWNKLKRIHVRKQLLEPLIPQFTQALKALPQILQDQRQQKKKSGQFGTRPKR